MTPIPIVALKLKGDGWAENNSHCGQSTRRGDTLGLMTFPTVMVHVIVSAARPVAELPLCVRGSVADSYFPISWL